MKSKFKVGQKVKLVCHGILGNEGEEWTLHQKVDFTLGETYVVYKVNPNNEFGPCISLENLRDWVFHEDHFAPFKFTNEERIAVRMKELNV